MKKDLQKEKQAASKKIIESFEIFPWISDFETGVPVIDEQHRVLVRLLNGLARDLANHTDSQSLDAVFHDLNQYAAFHFDTEETLMQKFIPGDELESIHQKIHRGFVKEIGRLKTPDGDDSTTKRIEEIVVFLSRWLANHILDDDRRMAKVILAIEAGTAAEAAKAEADAYMSGAVKELNDTVLGMYAKLSSRTFKLMKELVEHKEEAIQLQSLQSIEWEHIQHVLKEHDGNISATARTLNMHRRTLQRKLRKPPL